jgi:hypothetical protein
MRVIEGPLVESFEAIFILHLTSITWKKSENTGHTQNNGAVSIVNTIETAPFVYVCTVHEHNL